jgi:putative hydrolase of the HAD superfamily
MLRQPDRENSHPVKAVTFDCWGTLIYERDSHSAYAARVEELRRVGKRAGIDTDPLQARAALDAAWTRHWELWQAGRASDSLDISRWALGALGCESLPRAQELSEGLGQVALSRDVVVLDGAQVTLERLASLNIRRALICDTGFSPGQVVRELLHRVGLLDLLEVSIFSDEAGVPKPHADVFHAALEPLAVAPHHAVHVGDLRHTDIRGARAMGMGTIRINDHHDDLSPLPDADAIAESHAELRRILGLEE